jgi:hypothetical protein
MALFSVNSQELLEVAATDFMADMQLRIFFWRTSQRSLAFSEYFQTVPEL